jgi:hypothetical protein
VYLTLTKCVLFLSIQYVRHLHDKVANIDERTAPKKAEDQHAEHAAAAAAAMGGSMMGLGETLMLTNGPAYGGGYGADYSAGAAGYGAPAGYGVPPAAGGYGVGGMPGPYGGAPAAPGYGAPAYGGGYY